MGYHPENEQSLSQFLEKCEQTGIIFGRQSLTNKGQNGVLNTEIIWIRGIHPYGKVIQNGWSNGPETVIEREVIKVTKTFRVIPKSQE